MSFCKRKLALPRLRRAEQRLNEWSNSREQIAAWADGNMRAEPVSLGVRQSPEWFGRFSFSNRFLFSLSPPCTEALAADDQLTVSVSMIASWLHRLIYLAEYSASGGHGYSGHASQRGNPRSLQHFIHGHGAQR